MKILPILQIFGIILWFSFFFMFAVNFLHMGNLVFYYYERNVYIICLEFVLVVFSAIMAVSLIYEKVKEICG